MERAFERSLLKAEDVRRLVLNRATAAGAAEVDTLEEACVNEATLGAAARDVMVDWNIMQEEAGRLFTCNWLVGL